MHLPVNWIDYYPSIKADNYYDEFETVSKKEKAVLT